MTYLKRGVGGVLAIVAAASMQIASADIIDSTQALVTTTGTTHTDIVDGGNVSHFFAYDTSSVAVSGGRVSRLTLNDSAAAEISGGDISWLRVYDSSTASITGALDLSWLIVSETAHVDIYATNTLFSRGLLSGTWLDGTMFEFWAVLGSPAGGITITELLPSNITIHSPTSVPEPATMLLMALGVLGAGVAKRSRARRTEHA